jgi:hypothetical protein
MSSGVLEMNQSEKLGLMHLVLWFPLTFATPLLIALNNPSDVTTPIPVVLLTLLILVTTLTGTTYITVKLAKPKWQRRISRIVLGLGIIFVLQGNLIHDLFYYGEFDGAAVNWRSSGWIFWLELVAFSLAVPIVLWLLLRARKIPDFVIYLPLLSCIVLLIPTILRQAREPSLDVDQSFDQKVFEFSRQLNLVHLLPDALQSDIVHQVLKENPALANGFSGFTLYTDHLGLYKGTAPTVPALFNGRPYGLHLGLSGKRTVSGIQEHAYTNTLAENGFRLDYVPTNAVYCIDEAETCVPRPFNDLKAHGYYNYRSPWYSVRLVTDLVLFRHTPMYFKEMIYDNGNWLFSETTTDGSSPYPDPVIREWIDNISIVEGPPRYKFYHSIGSHRPVQWDEQCNFRPDLEHNRDNAKKQTICVLRGISNFLDKLKKEEIYDNTAIIITGDHGCVIEANDITGTASNRSLPLIAYSQARPTFLVKPIASSGPLVMSSVPTSILDVAPTALDLVGLSGSSEGLSALRLKEGQVRKRLFRFYSNKELWGGKPVPYKEYEVIGPVNDLNSWRLTKTFKGN